MRQRRKPSRMTLTQDVGKTGAERRSARRETPGPFAGMNQTVARLPPRPPRAVPSRARMAIKSKIREQTAVTRAPIRTATRVIGDARDPGDGPRATAPRREKKDKDERPLFHALKMQQTLTPLSYGQRNKLKQQMDKVESFEDLGLMPSVVNAIYTQVLPHLTEYTPTAVQKLAIPALLSKKGEYQKHKAANAEGNPVPNKFKTTLLAAETGSGKTLAYLLPVINSVKQQEKLDHNDQLEREAQEAQDKEDRDKNTVFDPDPFEDEHREPPNPAMGRPRALILLPSTELITQVTRTVKQLSHTIKYRSAGISSSNTPTVIRNRLFNPSGIDVLISSPHLIASIAKKEPNILSRIQYLVMDEADSLLDRSFAETTCEIIDRAAPSLKQLILCSATIPNSLDKFIDKRFPDCKRIVTPKLHTIPRRVQLGAVDIDRAPYRGDRDLACADVIWTLGKAVHEDLNPKNTVKHILVFVNEREKADALATFLVSKGVEAVALTRDTTEQRQAEILSTFTAVEKVEGSSKPASATSPTKKLFKDFVPFDRGTTPAPTAGKSTAKPTRHLPDVKVLVTTDLGSRGVDTMAVRHVVLYDVPHTTIDFVHRLGRMGRMNRRGRGIVLMGGKDRKDVIREVREAMFRGQALI
ncbi:RNA helicase [Cladophialophora chaetospira]|uniref:RNA helicase n=1 Tax=Cladophialophora chaetospira TaxID=386627 RepID=A0AA39CHE3_9EURO|nr:RNA helicase [Cladophialophora chaetospira]